MSKLKYDDIKFNPRGDVFAQMRQIMINKEILAEGLDLIIDSREKLAKRAKEWFEKKGYDVEIKQLQVGDYLFEGGTAFEKKYTDITNIPDVLTKATELRLAYPHPYLIVMDDIQSTIQKKYAYGGQPMHVAENMMIGMYGSLAVRGVPPLFAHNEEFMYRLMDSIARKHLDGKDRIDEFKIDAFRVKTSDDYTFALYLNLPHVGEDTAEKLIELYPSIVDLIKAKPEDLQEIDGIGKKTANDIYDALRGKVIE